MVLMLLMTTGAALADVLPPGHKWVKHDVHFEGIKDYPNYVFYLWPRDLSRGRAGNSSVRVPESGETTLGGNPLARAQSGGTFLFAVPTELFGGDPARPPDEAWFEGKEKRVLKSAPLVGEVRTARQGDPRDRFLTRYRVAIKFGKLETELLSQEQPSAETADTPGGEDRSPTYRWLLAGGMGLAAVMAALGLMFARWRRRLVR